MTGINAGAPSIEVHKMNNQELYDEINRGDKVVYTYTNEAVTYKQITSFVAQKLFNLREAPLHSLEANNIRIFHTGSHLKQIIKKY